MIREILTIIGISLIPLLELRASIPYGIVATQLHWSVVFLAAVIGNILVGPLAYFIIDKVIHIFFFIKPFKRVWYSYVAKTQKKIAPYVEKYGEWALAIFIGIPLPGTGVYTGAVAAYFTGMKKRTFFIATVAGVLIAGILVMLVTMLGIEALTIFIK